MNSEYLVQKFLFKILKKNQVHCIFKVLDYCFVLSGIYHLVLNCTAEKRWCRVQLKAPSAQSVWEIKGAD